MNEKCPFREACKYRVKRDYSFFNHKFNSGEFVVFMAFGYSPKEGVTRYWFKKIDSEETNAWHVSDNQKADFHWMDLFEEIGFV